MRRRIHSVSTVPHPQQRDMCIVLSSERALLRVLSRFLSLACVHMCACVHVCANTVCTQIVVRPRRSGVFAERIKQALVDLRCISVWCTYTHTHTHTHTILILNMKSTLKKKCFVLNI
jgi:hypothetical protein